MRAKETNNPAYCVYFRPFHLRSQFYFFLCAADVVLFNSERKKNLLLLLLFITIVCECERCLRIWCKHWSPSNEIYKVIVSLKTNQKKSFNIYVNETYATLYLSVFVLYVIFCLSLANHFTSNYIVVECSNCASEMRRN